MTLVDPAIAGDCAPEAMEVDTNTVVLGTARSSDVMNMDMDPENCTIVETSEACTNVTPFVAELSLTCPQSSWRVRASVYRDAR